MVVDASLAEPAGEVRRVSVHVRNEGPETLRLIGEVRRIEYDSADGSLVLSFADEAPDRDEELITVSGRPFNPPTLELLPGEETTLTALLPSSITVLASPQHEGGPFEERPIGRVDRVICRFAYDTVERRGARHGLARIAETETVPQR